MARPMKPGRHATPDRSFSRSTGGAAMRGGLLLAVAVVLGVILLNTSDNGPSVPTGLGTTPTADSTVDTVPTDTSTTLPGGSTIPAVTQPVLAGRSPAEVKVMVANGSKIKGAAAAGSEKLRPAGYSMLEPADATNKPRENAVLYVAGYETEAADVATRLGIPAAQVTILPPTPPVADLKGANILVVVGTGLASTLTSTTAAPA